LSGNPYAPLRAGDGIDKISATAWNDLMRMLTWWRGRTAAQPSRPASPPNPSVVLVQNNGPDVPWYGIVGISKDTVADPGADLQSWQQQPILQGNELYGPDASTSVPDVTKHRCNFAVALEPIETGAIGRCAIAGVVPVQIYLDGTLKGVMAADVKGGDVTQLTLTPGGYRILYLQSGSAGSTVWGWVHLGNKEGPLYAQQTSDQDGTHPTGATRTYSLAAPSPTSGILAPFTPLSPAVVVPVMNQIAKVEGDARTLIAEIQGMYGQYQLVSIDPCDTPGWPPPSP
jgi:hypothetical protein